MAILERIVTVYNDKGSKEALKDLRTLEESFVNAGKTIAKAFGAATVAAGAFALKVGKDSVQAAMEDQKAQRILALTLQKTTNATQSQVAAVEAYILQTSLATGITDNELRPAFSRLVRSTNDVASAQSLLNLTLDISSATGRSVELIANSLGKAYDGNASALGRLGLGIDQSIIKSKDFNKIFTVLQTTFGGFAEKEAQTLDGRIRRVGVAIDELKENIGFALLPVFEDLVKMFADDILPILQEFAETNQQQIAESFKDVITFGIQAAKALGSMFKTISNNLTTFKVFAGILTGIFIGTKVYAGIIAITGALKLLTLQFRRQAVAGTAAGTATAFATGGTSALAAAAGLTAFAAAAGVTWLAINKLTGAIETNGKTTEKYSQVVSNHLKDLQGIAEATAKAQGVGGATFDTKSTQDAINAKAAELNLIREGKIEQAAFVAEEQKKKEAIKATIAEAQKYQDILQALADTKITTEEIAVLAAKWGLSTEAVKNYLAQYFAVADRKITSDEITLLAQAWGLTSEQAEKYLDFVNALKDSKLSPQEIADLQDKWGMTVGEIEKYADFVLKVRDFKITDAEVKELGKAWGLSNEEVLRYLENIGVPFDYNGKFIDPVNGVGKAWKDTTGAVDAYIKSVGDADTALGTLATNAATNAASVTTALGTATDAAGALATASTAALGIAEAAQAAAEGAIATAQLASAQAEYARAAAAAAAAAIAEAEAAAALASVTPTLPTPVSPGDFGDNTVAGGINSGSFLPVAGTTSGGSTVNITVNGSVVSQDDLISTVRTGLLAGIGSGQVTTYDPRTIPG